MITCVSSNECPNEWDILLRQAGPETNFLQSSFWAHLICTLDEAIPHYIQIFDGSQLLAQALFLQRWAYDRNNKYKLSTTSGLECLDGPVILQTDRMKDIMHHLLVSASSLAKNTCSSNTVITFSHTSRWANSPEMQDLFIKQRFTVGTWATSFVDLTPDEDELFMKIAHAARKCIKKCKKHQIHIETLDTYHRFQDEFMPNYNSMEKASGRPAVYCTLAPPEHWKKYYRHFLAKDGDTILGALGMFMFNGVATEVQSTISQEAFEKKIPVQDLLHWELMLEAKRLGCHTFDLAGFNPNPMNNKEIGIARFKAKWGGQNVKYNCFKKEQFSARGYLLKLASRTKAIIKNNKHHFIGK